MKTLFNVQVRNQAAIRSISMLQKTSWPIIEPREHERSVEETLKKKSVLWAQKVSTKTVQNKMLCLIQFHKSLLKKNKWHVPKKVETVIGCLNTDSLFQYQGSC